MQHPFMTFIFPDNMSKILYVKYRSHSVMGAQYLIFRVSFRFGARGHLDLAPGQSLYKALKFFKIFNWRDDKSSQAKPSICPVPGH